MDFVHEISDADDDEEEETINNVLSNDVGSFSSPTKETVVEKNMSGRNTALSSEDIKPVTFAIDVSALNSRPLMSKHRSPTRKPLSFNDSP